MAKKSIDWNQLLLEKGDRFGLAIAVCLGVLLLLTSLFWPKSGLLATSQLENAKVLDSQAKNVEQKMASSKPEAQDMPANPDVKPPGFVLNKIEDLDGLRVTGLFPAAATESSSRRQPELLEPNEGRAAVVLAQVRSYIFKFGQDTKVMVLQGAKDTGNQAQRMYGMSKGLSASRGMGASYGSNPRLQAPSSMSAAPEDSTRKDYVAEFVPLNKLDENPGAKLAETVRPLRMAEIVASFPYKRQLGEFRDKLRLPSDGAVLQELSQEVEEMDKTPLPAFRFLGVRVQRRAVDELGKPLASKAPEGWEELDLEGTFKPYVILAGKRTEPEDPKLDPIEFDGLVMPRLLQVRSDQYPNIETDLKSIKETLDSLANINPAKVAGPPAAFDKDTFKIFQKGTPTTDQMGPMGPMGRGPAFGPNPASADRPGLSPSVSSRRSDSMPMPGTPGAPGTLGTDLTAPDYCLIRLIDVTVQPGKIYQYRIQVRMANPNYKRTDVASPAYAEDVELKTDKWLVIGGAEKPQSVVVPPEQIYYAVDQKDVDGSRNYKGIHAWETLKKDHQVAFQIHQWTENVNDDRRSFTPVGEWLIAERIPVNRGEYIGRKERVEVPLWRETMDAFVLAATGTAGRQKSGMDVNFSHARDEAILVDFEGPDHGYQRAGGPAVKETTTTEVLILSHDGKLLACDSEADKNNKDRKDRLEAWRQRIKDVKEQKPAGDPSKPATGNPFGNSRTNN